MRLVQSGRTLALGARGQWFKSTIAYRGVYYAQPTNSYRISWVFYMGTYPNIG